MNSGELVCCQLQKLTNVYSRIKGNIVVYFVTCLVGEVTFL